MKVAVIGSRTFTDKELMFRSLDEIKDITVIVSGGARGADRLAENYAAAHGLLTEIYKPDWNNTNVPGAIVGMKLGKEINFAAGFDRNKKIVDNAELVIAFWDGKSKGTKNSLEYAKERNKNVKVIKFVPKDLKHENVFTR